MLSASEKGFKIQGREESESGDDCTISSQFDRENESRNIPVQFAKLINR